MSSKYPGGIISKTAPTPSGPYASDTAPGVWTLEQQAYWQKLGQWPTAGNVNPSAFIENLFSTYLYSGTGASQNIVNGIDLSTNGGLVWIKSRTSNVQAWNHSLTDTVRGNASRIYSNLTGAANSAGTPNGFTYNSNGFTVGVSDGTVNNASETYASWTFREQAKFFDVVTYSGDATTSGRAIPHNLGSTPGFVIIKNLTTASDWTVWHRSLTSGNFIVLNTTDAQTSAGAATRFGNGSTTVDPTSTDVTVGGSYYVNAAGYNYVMYVFAHNAGGFGTSGTDNVISCGSATIDGGGQATVNLGYEPQWIFYKSSTDVQNWYIYDVMRGMPVGTTSGPYSSALSPNATTAEFLGASFAITPTGFNIQTSIAGATYIYVAIRRGPMAVPTLGTSVYNAIARTGTGATANVTGVGFPVDLNWSHIRDAAYPNVMDDRLRGSSNTLKPSTTDGEASSSTVTSFSSMDGVQYGTSDRTNASGNTYINWYFKRAPGFFDEVCYTGTGANRTVAHNLTVAPELMIFKQRNSGGYWMVYPVPLGDKYLVLQRTDAVANGFAGLWNSTAPTSSVFSLGTGSDCNQSGGTYVSYLFATCPGVSKVGTYTGTGALQTVNCGFTSGARFVLIKRTDSTGDWYMYDSVRGITSGNDPYLFANVDAVEVTGTNYVDTDTTGFKVTAAAPAGLNASGGAYIFLAIA
jgi:hypothetical protein